MLINCMYLIVYSTNIYEIRDSLLRMLKRIKANGRRLYLHISVLVINII